MLFHTSKSLRHCGIISNVRVLTLIITSFTARLTSSRLSNPAPYSGYHSELHDLIKRLHDKGMGYRKIAHWLNANGYKTPRGKMFFNTHIFSILKKKRLRDERLHGLPEDRFEITSPLRIEYLDRKLINSR